MRSTAIETMLLPVVARVVFVVFVFVYLYKYLILIYILSSVFLQHLTWFSDCRTIKSCSTSQIFHT